MRVVLVESDPRWPEQFADLRRRLSVSLGDAVRRIEHVGSTSVAGLVAKPVIDIVATVDDPTAEHTYVPALTAIGYELRAREPEWYEHRVFRLDDPASNLHVFADDCVEVGRMLRFRDRLRADIDDRRRYEALKRALAESDWPTVQHYADAKSAVVAEILAAAGQPDA